METATAPAHRPPKAKNHWTQTAAATASETTTALSALGMSGSLATAQTVPQQADKNENRRGNRSGGSDKSSGTKTNNERGLTRGRSKKREKVDNPAMNPPRSTKPPNQKPPHHENGNNVSPVRDANKASLFRRRRRENKEKKSSPPSQKHIRSRSLPPRNGGGNLGEEEEVLSNFLRGGDNPAKDDVLGKTDSEPPTPSKPSKKLDKYGFIVNLDDQGQINDDEVTPLPSDNPAFNVRHSARQMQRTTAKREKKWTSMMDSWEKTQTKRKKKLRKRVRKGVPDSLRGTAWALLGNVPNKIEFEHPGLYESLIRRTTEGVNESQRGLQTRDTIDRDINRTFPRHHMFYDGSDDSEEDMSTEDSEASSLLGLGGGENVEEEEGGDVPSWVKESDVKLKVGSAALVRKEGSGESGRRSPFDKAAMLLGACHDAVGGLENIFVDEEVETVAAVATGQPLAMMDWNGNRTTTTTTTTIATGTIPTEPKPEAADAAKTEESKVEQKVPTAPTTEKAAPEPPSAPAVTRGEKKKKQGDTGKEDYAKATGGQASLRRVLRAYSVYDKDVGYCQGMNFIAAMFITFVSEEEAFWMLVAVMNDPPCRMRGLFGEGMSGAHRVLHVAEKLILQFLPKLSQHLERENVHITMYATQWLLTLYTSSFPFDLVTRVWDCFLAEGWKIVYRVMLAILEQSAPDLMKLRFEDILAYFREIPNKVDGDEILSAALKIPLRKKHIVKYESEWLKRNQ